MKCALAIVAALTLLSGSAAAQSLKPFKDKLFAYPATLETAQGERYLEVDYDKAREIHARDEIPLRRVKRDYVNERVRWSRRVKRYTSPNGTFKYFEVGKRRGSVPVTIVFIHGRRGNRFLGVNDWTFGGNFNRVQNLMVRNGGLYLSPEFTDFGAKGTADIATLIRQYRKRSPNTRMIVACGSMGSGICWGLAKGADTAPLVDGMFIMGGHWDDAFLSSPPMAKGGRPIPLWFGHGTFDTVFSPDRQRAFFNSILKKRPNYPARFVMFRTGKHGTPIRMVDWRRELNWMLSGPS